MPRPSGGEKRNFGRLPLTDKFPDTLDCVRVFLPDDQYYKSLLVGALNKLARQIYYERDDDHTAKKIAEMWSTANRETFGNGFEGCNSDENCPAPTGGNDNQKGHSAVASMENLLKMMEELDVKYSLDGQLYEAAIPLVPCGCGGSGDDGTTPPLAIPGASGGGPYSGLTTLCDALTPLLNYIPNAVDDYLGNLQNISFFAEIIDAQAVPLANDVISSVDDVVVQLQDASFVNGGLKRAIIEAFNDPWTDATRADLRSFARKIPMLSEGAPMQAAFILWAETANLTALNNAAKSESGSTTQADCLASFAEFGRTPFNRNEFTPIDENVATLEYDDGTHVWTTKLAVLGAPYTTSRDYNTPITASGTRTLGAAGISTSNWNNDAGTNFWRRPRLMIGAEGSAAPFADAAGDVAIGSQFYVGVNFIGTEMTQTTFDAILAQIEAKIGAFPQSAIPELTLTQASYAYDGPVQAGAPGSVPAGAAVVVDWFFVTTREAS